MTGRDFCEDWLRVVVAGLRGFLMDLCATHDRVRVNRAVAAWLKALNFLARPGKK